MKITIEFIERPLIRSYTLIGGKPDLELLKKEKKISVTFNHESKTRISTAMQFGDFRTGINFEIEGFKTFASNSHNYFSGEHSIRHYFIKSKKQNFEQYLAYMTQCVRTAIKDVLHVELDSLTILVENGKF